MAGLLSDESCNIAAAVVELRPGHDPLLADGVRGLSRGPCAGLQMCSKA